MRSETAGFERSSHAYERGRPGYPPETVSYIVSRAGLGPGKTVVDLAAGTGKLTRELEASGARVIAVEPLGEMRARLVEALPEVEAVEGTAEKSGLDDEVADALTVAQAFHWFAQEEALKEIYRILRPDGLMFLVWNRRDLSHPVQAAISQLTAPYIGEAPSYLSGRWRDVMGATTLFGPSGESRSRFAQQLDRAQLVDRVASTSYIANLDDEVRIPLLRQIEELAPDRGTIELPYSSEVYAYRRS